MALPSFLKRKAPASGAARKGASEDAGPVEAARTQARRRLIGAVVLLALGIVVFPLVFETTPRPVPANVPIETPKRGAVAPAPSPAAPRTVVPRPAAPVATEVPTDTTAESMVAASAQPPAAPPKPVPAPVAVATPKPTPPPVPAAPPVTARADDGKRAQALLEGSAAEAAAKASASGRFVVQVGAFSDNNALRETRQKVEKLGLKTYVQEVDTKEGKARRLRVGPFATREEADSADAKLRAAGLQPKVYTL